MNHHMKFRFAPSKRTAPKIDVPLSGPQFDSDLADEMLDAILPLTESLEVYVRAVRSDDPLIRAQASATLTRTASRALSNGPVRSSSTHANSPFSSSSDRAMHRLLAEGARLFGTVHDGLSSFLPTLVPVNTRKRRFAWAVTSLLLTGLIGFSIYQRSFPLALGLLALRVGVAGPFAATEPLDGPPKNPVKGQQLSPHDRLNLCLLTHAADVALLGFIAVGFGTSDRPWWNALLIGAIGTTLIAAMGRGTAWQAGVLLHRTIFERYSRVGGAAVALVLASLLPGHAFEGTFPVLAVLPISYVLYGLGEVYRTQVELAASARDNVAVALYNVYEDGEVSVVPISSAPQALQLAG